MSLSAHGRFGWSFQRGTAYPISFLHKENCRNSVFFFFLPRIVINRHATNATRRSAALSAFEERVTKEIARHEGRDNAGRAAAANYSLSRAKKASPLRRRRNNRVRLRDKNAEMEGKALATDACKCVRVMRVCLSWRKPGSAKPDGNMNGPMKRRRREK